MQQGRDDEPLKMSIGQASDVDHPRPTGLEFTEVKRLTLELVIREDARGFVNDPTETPEKSAHSARMMLPHLLKSRPQDRAGRIACSEVFIEAAPAPLHHLLKRLGHPLPNHPRD